MRLVQLPSLLSLLAFTSALPTPEVKSKPLPLIIWHGLGDRFDADGLQSTGKLAEQVHPGTFVYYIRTDDDGGNDRTNTFFGNITTQIEQICDALHNEPGLLNDDEELRVDALGFSQGGQFLRGLVERCEGLSVRSLVTFGSQHNGIAEFQKCGDLDFLCKGATALVKGNAWTDYVQNTVVPAQYYRTLNESTGTASDEYLEHSNFLADINNEREERNEEYAERIAALEKFVMIVFEEDKTVIPPASGWFAEVNATSGHVTPLRERDIYKEDWIGLKRLDAHGGLVFRNTSGAHMELDEKTLRVTFEEFFGPERSALERIFNEDANWVEVFSNEDMRPPFAHLYTHEDVMKLNLEQLQDYQKQLMLVEKQNRERLLAAGMPEREEETADPGMRCGSDEAQAAWDSLSWWDKQKWHWRAVTLPWLRGAFSRARNPQWHVYL